MSRTMVGVLRGGTSSEYDFSLKSGASVIEALHSRDYGVRDILIDKRGVWHVRGIPVTPMRALSQVDVVYNALHGGVGEDGSVGRVLEQSGIPYVGSRPLASSIALNKVRARQIFAHSGLRIPKGLAFRVTSGLSTGEMARAVFRAFPPPYVVKPTSEGASKGLRVVRTLPELPDTLGDALDEFGSVLVEEYIAGHHATVGVIENFRNQRLYTLPPVHIILPLGASIIERQHLQDDILKHRVPSNFSDAQKNYLSELARSAHQTLGLTHVSQADFVVTPKNTYLLEVNTNPTLYKGSSFERMLDSVGSSIADFVSHLVAQAQL